MASILRRKRIIPNFSRMLFETLEEYDNYTLAMNAVKKIRKNVETVGSELLVALLCAGVSFDAAECPPTLFGCALEQFHKYRMDMLARPASDNAFSAANFLRNRPVEWEGAQLVYLTGKSFADAPEINALNAGLDRKVVKADVYLKLSDNSFVGVSVKQSEEATKSNYSVEKMFSKEDSFACQKARRDMLATIGVSTYYDESKRDEVNALFYDRTNPYWTLLRANIEKYKPSITKTLVDCLYGARVPYPLYEFDGTALIRLNAVELAGVTTFEEHLPFYMCDDGVTHRRCAKVFYRLVTSAGSYRVEVRWKGDCYGASPQFQIHSI
jgi:hypothetical protein